MYKSYNIAVRNCVKVNVDRNLHIWSFTLTYNTDGDCKLHYTMRGAVYVDMGKEN
jgi:hypothetical protein